MVEHCQKCEREIIDAWENAPILIMPTEGTAMLLVKGKVLAKSKDQIVYCSVACFAEAVSELINEQ